MFPPNGAFKHTIRCLLTVIYLPCTKNIAPTIHFKSDFKPEFVSLWTGWLGKQNLHKLDEVTPNEWEKFNNLIRQLSQRYTLLAISHKTKQVIKVTDIESCLSTYEQAMNKDPGQFSAFIILELSCAISESWDHTYIIWHRGKGEAHSLSPLIKACDLEHFSE